MIRVQKKKKIVMACPVLVSCGGDILNVHTGWVATSVMRVLLHINCVQCSAVYCSVLYKCVSYHIHCPQGEPAILNYHTRNSWWTLVWVELATWNTHTHTHIPGFISFISTEFQCKKRTWTNLKVMNCVSRPNKTVNFHYLKRNKVSKLVTLCLSIPKASLGVCMLVSVNLCGS